MNIHKYHSDTGQHIVIEIARGHKHIHVIPIEAGGLTIKRLPLSAERHFKPVEYKGQPYPEKRALRHLRSLYRRDGGTKAVKKALYA